MTRTRLRITLNRVAVGGDAIGHTSDLGGERRIVLVPGGLPGDEVDVEVDPSKRPLRGKLLRILSPSPERRDPPCPHTRACGGCAWMSWSESGRQQGYRTMLEASIGHVLAGAGAVPDIVFHAAPEERGYRTRARLAFHGGRQITLGFRAEDGKREVPVEACLVLDPRLAPALDVVRTVLAGVTGDGEASIALGRDDLPVLSLVLAGEALPATYRAIEEAVQAQRIAGVDLFLPGMKRPARTGDPSVITVGGDGLPLAVPAGGFAQANPSMNVRLAAHVESLCYAPVATLELHAGAGNLTTRLAGLPAMSSYETVEADEAAVAACRANLAARHLTNVKIHRGDAETFVIPSKIRRVILDPPRTGAKLACERLATSRVTEIVYVSCDPPTLARDAGRLLAAGFTARSLHAFEMVPLTPHVESVLHLVRA